MYVTDMMNSTNTNTIMNAEGDNDATNTNSTTATITVSGVNESEVIGNTRTNEAATTSPLGEDIVREVLAINTMAMQKCVFTTSSGTAFMPTSTNLINGKTASTSSHLKRNKTNNEVTRTLSKATIAEELSSASVLLLEAFEKLSSFDSNCHTGNNNVPVATDSLNENEHAGSERKSSQGIKNANTDNNVKANAETAMMDEQLRDQLKAITLNNMGVVECHRGQPRRALSHFEAARQIEENWNFTSPSLALNTCAVYNALKMYDKATAAALETIEMLRTLEYQRKRYNKLGEGNEKEGNDLKASSGHVLTTTTITTAAAAMKNNNNAKASIQKQIQGVFHPTESNMPMMSSNRELWESEEEVLMMAAAAQPTVADSNNLSLWGAAWHNLAVAQLNTALHSHHSYDIVNNNINSNEDGNDFDKLTNTAKKNSNNNNSGNNNTAVNTDVDSFTDASASYFHAQLNKERMKGDVSEHANTLALFHNAMRATIDLLGVDHPMTCAVVQTYRSVRRCLYKHGAFTRHRTCATAPLPPIDPREAEFNAQTNEYNSEELNDNNNNNNNNNKSTKTNWLTWANVSPELLSELKQSVRSRKKHGSTTATLTSLKALHELQQRQLLITFRGEVTKGAKATELLVKTPYPGAENDDDNAFVHSSHATSATWHPTRPSYHRKHGFNNTERKSKRATSRFVRRHLHQTAKIYSGSYQSALPFEEDEHYKVNNGNDDVNTKVYADPKYKNSYLLPDIYEIQQHRRSNRKEWNNTIDNNNNNNGSLHSYETSQQREPRSSSKNSKYSNERKEYKSKEFSTNNLQTDNRKNKINLENAHYTSTESKASRLPQSQKTNLQQKEKKWKQQQQREQEEDRRYYLLQKKKQEEMQRESKRQANEARQNEERLRKKHAAAELEAQRQLMYRQREHQQQELECRENMTSTTYGATHDITRNAPPHMRRQNGKYERDFATGNSRRNQNYSNEEDEEDAYALATNAAINIELEQPKFILLAQPPTNYELALINSANANKYEGDNVNATVNNVNANATTETNDTVNRDSVNASSAPNINDNSSVSQRDKPFMMDGMTQVDEVLPENMYANSNNANGASYNKQTNAFMELPTNNELQRSTTPRELFNAMWVAADAHYIYQGKRNFKVDATNSNVCRRLSQIMNVTADGELLTGMSDAIMRRDRSTTPILMMVKDSRSEHAQSEEEYSSNNSSRSSSSSDVYTSEDGSLINNASITDSSDENIKNNDNVNNYDNDDNDEKGSKTSINSTKSKSRTITPSAFSKSV